MYNPCLLPGGPHHPSPPLPAPCLGHRTHQRWGPHLHTLRLMPMLAAGPDRAQPSHVLAVGHSPSGPPHPLLAPANSALPLSLLCPAGYGPPCPSQRPSPLTAVHHPSHEVPGVGAAVSQRASGPGELQQVTGALGMCHGRGQQCHRPSAGVSPGARGRLALGLAAQPRGSAKPLSRGPNPPTRLPGAPLTAFLPPPSASSLSSGITPWPCCRQPRGSRSPQPSATRSCTVP